MAYQKEHLYAIKNENGQWFRRGHIMQPFTDSFSQARIYIKIGQARSIVTRETRCGTPCHLVKLVISEQIDIYENDRVQKSEQKRLLKKLNLAKREKEWQLECAKRDLEYAQKQVEKLTNNNLGEDNG